jgi:predicted Rossmann fold flavoprotein
MVLSREHFARFLDSLGEARSRVKAWDAVILGAGGAGLMCALQAARRGRRVLVLDHADKVGGKILISGGGRCNFTNTGASPAQYVSRNPHFCKSALSRFPAESFIELVRAHGIPFHEKKLGQLFCDRSARDIVQMLQAECDAAGVAFELGVKILGVTREDGAGYRVQTSAGERTAPALVVATGGLSIPKLGATGLGYDLARQFGLRLVARRPALDGFMFAEADVPFYRELAGVSVDCVLACNGFAFRENILFTHAGLSGPAALQVSLHWNTGDEITADLLPGHDTLAWLAERRRAGSRALVKTLLGELLPQRLADALCARHLGAGVAMHQTSEKALAAFATELHRWVIRPRDTVGYQKAEVTRGGVDTDELSSKTMEAKKVPGLYFIGEVVDVTGWLGGYNFQWAWASGWAAAQAV